MSVCFATKCWGGDWQKMISGGFSRKYESCEYPFDSLALYVNNGVPVPTLMGYDVDVHAPNTLKKLKLKKEDFGEGYRYSICELTAIVNAVHFDYLCYLQGDCLMHPASDWVTDGIKILEDNPDVWVVSPSSEVNTWHGKDNKDQYFSDHAWLIRVKDWRKPNLFPKDSSDIPDYPAYGGDLFERKAAKVLRQNGKYRYILPNHYYLHPAI